MLPAIRDATNWTPPQNWTPLRLRGHMRGTRAAFDLPIRGNAAGRPRSLAPTGLPPVAARRAGRAARRGAQLSVRGHQPRADLGARLHVLQQKIGAAGAPFRDLMRRQVD